jgi:hypothetical protein
MALYLVRGPLRYRDHDVGETFEAHLDPDVEARALELGTIEVLNPDPPGLRPGSWTLPAGWQTTPQQPPQGGCSREGAEAWASASR